MLTGTRINELEIGQKIGHGGFGDIYIAQNVKDRKLYAIKTERLNSSRKTLEFEAQIMKVLTKYDNFPTFYGFGCGPNFLWLSMELLGPSLSFIIKKLPNRRLSVKCGFVISSHILKSIKILHECGIIHRDIKPGNVLIRRSFNNPVALIDFGLSRIYINDKTGQHVPPRSHPGFRGTSVYASPNAHMHQDLSRRDDMISWFYLTIDILSGVLPWKHLQNKADILHSKRRMNVEEICSPIAQELVTIWKMISDLEFTERPHYEEILCLMESVIQRNADDNAFDWHPAIYDMNGQYYERFGGFIDTNIEEKQNERKLRRSSLYTFSPSKNINGTTPLLNGQKENDCYIDDDKLCCSCKI